MSKYINYVKKILVWVFEINGDTRRYETITMKTGLKKE
tara:strand:+ start:3336 stop:3449 length:114 start_codon:yes stop_codon:yes gene_type:complete